MGFPLLLQIRSIARKYKTQNIDLECKYQDLKKVVDGMKSKETQSTNTETAAPAVLEIPQQDQDRLRQEGRQQMETEMNERIRQLNEQVRTFCSF